VESAPTRNHARTYDTAFCFLLVVRLEIAQSPQFGNGDAAARLGGEELVLHVAHGLGGVNSQARQANRHNRGPLLPNNRPAEPHDQSRGEHCVDKGLPTVFTFISLDFRPTRQLPRSLQW
jgi:hypothetical protein